MKTRSFGSRAYQDAKALADIRVHHREHRCACGRPLSENCKGAVCGPCQRTQQTAWELQMQGRVAPVTHIAGYVPPKGSVAQQFLGRVVNPIRGLGA